VLRVSIFAVVLAVAALPRPGSAQAPNASPPARTSAIHPGTYDLEIAFGGGVIKGTLDLTAAGDSLTAKLHVGDHEPPVRSLTRNGSHVVLTVGGEGTKIVYDLTFAADAVNGTLTYNGDPGFVTGKRRKE
jgi:hypothetical protein